jgi:protein-S-isoprenylcysteine O-methyltransferase
MTQCTVAYALAAWNFFAARIPYEEQKLREFFGDQYVAYCKRVPIRIPLMS